MTPASPRRARSLVSAGGLGGAVTALLLFVLLQADLKVSVHPYVHWLVALPLLTLLSFWSLSGTWRVDLGLMLALWGVPAGMALGLALAPATPYDLVQIGKVAVIFLSALILYNVAADHRAVRRAFVASTLVNAALVVGAAALALPTAQIMTGDGRWGTLLNYPGSLAKVGVLTLGYSLYGTAALRGRLGRFALLTLASLAAIALDGSRTAILGSALVSVFIVGVLSLEFLRRATLGTLTRALRLPLALGLVVAAALALGSGVAERTARLIGNLTSAGTSAGLARSDATRYEMLEAVTRAIAQHPVIGTGMGTTVAGELDMTVHLSYLQLWADAGVFAFLGLVLLSAFGLWTAFGAALRALARPDAQERAFIYGMGAVILHFVFNGFFHPFSTEWSEWVLFIVPVCVLRRFLKGGAGR